MGSSKEKKIILIIFHGNWRIEVKRTTIGTVKRHFYICEFQRTTFNRDEEKEFSYKFMRYLIYVVDETIK